MLEVNEVFTAVPVLCRHNRKWIILGMMQDELERTEKSTVLDSLRIGAGMGGAIIIGRVQRV